MGKQYYQSTMPRIAKALERIAAALEEQNERESGKEEQIDMNMSEGMD